MTSPADAPRPGSWLPTPPPPTPGAAVEGAPAADEVAARLAAIPVSAHVEVLTAEHERLHRLLASIDQL